VLQLALAFECDLGNLINLINKARDKQLLSYDLEINGL